MAKFKDYTLTDIIVQSYGSPPVAEVLVVAGGGGGAGSSLKAFPSNCLASLGHGGGAGGLLYCSAYSINPLSYTRISVGAGGLAGISCCAQFGYSGQAGTKGSNSCFGPLISYGGGRGGVDGCDGTSPASGFPPLNPSLDTNGGSGGGGRIAPNVGFGCTPQGCNGGAQNPSSGIGTLPNVCCGASGGGGAACCGLAWVPPNIGYGGKGCQIAITGIATYYAGGGGGGLSVTNQPNQPLAPAGAPGGLGGGGTGGRPVNATSGTPNTGGGGGGGAVGSNFPAAGLTAYNAGNGGSGIVIVAYCNCFDDPDVIAGLCVAKDTTSRPGYKVFCFTAGVGEIGWITPFTPTIPVEILVAAGGGAGGGWGAAGATGRGGGGGGQVVYSKTLMQCKTNYTLSVGAGAPINSVPAPISVNGGNGSNSCFIGGQISYNMCGGGGGGGCGLGPSPGSTGIGNTGGGGGGSAGDIGVPGGLGILFNGGCSIGLNFGGGGGGGACGNGANGTLAPTCCGGTGGLSFTTPITGTPLNFGGGGGGGAVGPTGGTCGIGGTNAGNGASRVPAAKAATSGVANFGGGGGGAVGTPSFVVATGCGGGGGSGMIILAYSDTYANLTNIDVGLSYTYSSARPGYRVYCFTAGTGNICL